MPDLLPKLIARLNVWGTEAWQWFQDNVLEPERLIELGIIIVAYFLARLASGFIMKGLDMALGDFAPWRRIQPRIPQSRITAIVALILLWSGRLIMEPLAGVYILPLATSLLTAWIIISIATGFIASRELARMMSVAVWSLAALNILGVLTPIINVRDGAALPLGDSQVSVLDIITGLLTAGLLIWGALALAAILDRHLRDFPNMPASAAVLVGKTARFALLALAVLIALNTSGIDLTALAVFGGALGVGIGFGLQKVVGNFISGVILLMDRSIKPGDVIEINETYGRINKMAARYTSVITRDGTEFLIPNEDMITQPVVNWSHSNLLVRRKIPVQISYGSDLEKAMALMVEASLEVPRVLKTPEPRPLLKGFGSDGVDIELRMWIRDPENGVSNVASDVMMLIWTKFHDNNIEFPFPQRDVHITGLEKALALSQQKPSAEPDQS